MLPLQASITAPRLQPHPPPPAEGHPRHPAPGEGCPTLKAYFPRVLTTSRKGILEVKVWPWYTMGSPFGPSQQSTSRHRQPRFRALWVCGHPWNPTPSQGTSPLPSPLAVGVTPAGTRRQLPMVEMLLHAGQEELGSASPEWTPLLSTTWHSHRGAGRGGGKGACPLAGFAPWSCLGHDTGAGGCWGAARRQQPLYLM